MSKIIIIESQYLPPISTLVLFQNYNSILIDQYEHFERKSYRNRSHVCHSNGLLRLTVPLQKGVQEHIPMHEIIISDEEDWRKHHWQSIITAYNRSAFFEFYKDEFQEIFFETTQSLIELNLKLVKWILNQYKIKVDIELSNNYMEDFGNEFLDFRSAILPSSKKSSFSIEMQEYQQVFSDRLPFIKNLSSLDLLFNQGPQAKSYLLNEIKIMN